MGLRSDGWFRRDDEVGLEHRAVIRAARHPVAITNTKPIIGILNSVTDLNPCNLPLRHLADAVKAGVQGTAGIPVEMSTISLGEDLMEPIPLECLNVSNAPWSAWRREARRPT